MSSAKIKTTVATFLIAGTALFFYRREHKTPPPIDPRPHLAVGRVMAEEAAKLLGAGGSVLLVVRDTSVHPNPATTYQLQGFAEAALKKNLPFSATNKVKLDPLRVVKMPPGDFGDLLKRRNGGDVVVSLLGPAFLSEEQRAKLGGKKVSVVAFCSGAMPLQVDLRELFDQNLLHAAVISRASSSTATPQTDDSQAWFQHYYQLITRANLSDMPFPVGNQNR